MSTEHEAAAAAGRAAADQLPPITDTQAHRAGRLLAAVRPDLADLTAVGNVLAEGTRWSA